MEKHIIRQLYQNALREDAETDKPSQETKSAIEAMLKDAGYATGEPEYERHRDELLLAASAAEENGFVKGFIYAFRLFGECTSD